MLIWLHDDLALGHRSLHRHHERNPDNNMEEPRGNKCLDLASGRVASASGVVNFFSMLVDLRLRSPKIQTPNVADPHELKICGPNYNDASLWAAV